MFPCNLPGTNFPETWPCVHHNWSFIWKMMSQPWDGMVFPSSRQPPCLVNAVSIFIPCFLHWNCHVYCHGERRPPGTSGISPTENEPVAKVEFSVRCSSMLEMICRQVRSAEQSHITPWCCTYDGRGWYSWLMHPLTNTIRTKQIRVRSDRYSWMQQHFSSLKFSSPFAQAIGGIAAWLSPRHRRSFVRSSFSTAACQLLHLSITVCTFEVWKATVADVSVL